MQGKKEKNRFRPGTHCAQRRLVAKKAWEAVMMFIGMLTVEYYLHGNDSLKGKRRVANSLKQKVRNTFNVSIAEDGTEDSLARLRLAVLSLSNSRQHLQSRLDKCLAMMEAVCPEEMTYSDIEFLSMDEDI